MTYHDVMTCDGLTSKEIPNGVNQDTLTRIIRVDPERIDSLFLVISVDGEYHSTLAELSSTLLVPIL